MATRDNLQQWIEQGGKGYQFHDEMATYILTVHTRKNGFLDTYGTDSDVHITIHGTTTSDAPSKDGTNKDISKTAEITINGMISGNAFESNDTDSVTIVTRNVGDVKGLTVRKSGSDDWFPDRFSLQRVGGNTQTWTNSQEFESGKLTKRFGDTSD